MIWKDKEILIVGSHDRQFCHPPKQIQLPSLQTTRAGLRKWRLVFRKLTSSMRQNLLVWWLPTTTSEFEGMFRFCKPLCDRRRHTSEASWLWHAWAWKQPWSETVGWCTETRVLQEGEILTSKFAGGSCPGYIDSRYSGERPLKFVRLCQSSSHVFICKYRISKFCEDEFRFAVELKVYSNNVLYKSYARCWQN